MTKIHRLMVAIAAAAVFFLSGCTAAVGGSHPAVAVADTAAAGTALAQLDTIPVKGRAPKTGYDRELFGAAWADTDRNGCDTRNDILSRDLESVTYKPGTKDCVVQAGTLDDPFTGEDIRFERGQDTSSAVQIDHIIPLSDAWQKGAQQLSEAERRSLANDPLNLLAVDGPSNGSKSDSDAATWLPPNKDFRCEYVALQTAVKAKYNLWMTQAESAAIRGILEACHGQPVSEAVPAIPAAAPTPEEPAAAPVAPAADAVEAPAFSGVEYQNCAAVRAAGAAPITAGDPGWSPKFDADGDGVGCQ